MDIVALETVELETGPQPDASVIWLHGLGASGHDFEPFVPELKLPSALRFVFPHAPRQAVSINGGYVMRAWYDIAHPDLGMLVDETGIRTSVAAVSRLIDRERERGVAPSRIIVAGFSQGGVIALHASLRYPERLAGTIALSTYLPFPDSLDREAASANRGLPIFLAHGEHDSLIPITQAERARQQLTERGYPVDWHRYPMQHQVSREEIADISAFLQARLA
ncbi:alpha/beta hydrolase [Thermithiobacillus plumbiphilus]|uniref:Alpha/beta hydrolase n=1 Tax=Thermithiobacillus plumbiphilus TaxID=1729899 RepID=A0ABU9DA58_9PROT